MSGTELVRVEAVAEFCERARADAQRPAVADAEGLWSIGDVAAAAAALAQRLIAGPESGPVAVLVDRRMASVAASIAVSWAGRCIVLLDVEDPVERLAGIVHRSGALIVVDATGRGPTQLGDAIVVSPGEPIPDPSAWPEVRYAPADAAGHVVFTSGSTGQPKGVVRTFAQLNEVLELGRGGSGHLDPVPTASFFPLYFIAGWNSAVVGVCVGRFTLLPDLAACSVDAVVAEAHRYGVQRLMMSTSVLRALLHALPEGAALPALTQLWLLGEAVYWTDVDGARRKLAARVWVSAGFGASELVGVLTVNEISPTDPLGEGRVPLGRQVGPAQLRLEPIGADPSVGELIVRGQLVQGYLDDEELNAIRFGVDPDGIRFLRTGDIVHLDAHGMMHHRGRVDDMVKINGKLVEPAEIETALRALDGVRAAVVLPRETAAGSRQLVAHVEASNECDVADLRAALRRNLPAHLVPARIVRHEHFPLTDRGKVDRSALTSVLEVTGEPVVGAASIGYVDTLLETVVATARMLIDDDLGPDDSIWDFGCDSLTAIQLLNELSDNSDVLDPALLLEVSTCRQLTEVLRTGHRARRGNVVVLNEGAPRQPLVIIGGGGAFALTYRPLANEIGNLHRITIYEQRGLQRRGRRDHTVAGMARRTLRDLRQRQPAGPYVLIGYSWGGAVAHDMARRLTLVGEDVMLVLLDGARSAEKEVRPALPPPPERIRARSDVWPIWALKYVRWRAAHWQRRLVVRWRLLRRPVGSLERYRAFYLFSMRSLRRLRLKPLGIPVVLVHPVGSAHEHEWDDHTNLRLVVVGGDHNTMLVYPHVVESAEAVRGAVREVVR